VILGGTIPVCLRILSDTGAVGASSQWYCDELMLLKCELMLLECRINTDTNKNGFLFPFFADFKVKFVTLIS